MGQSKGGGYKKLPALTPQQTTLLNQMLGQASGNIGAASEGFKQFLPGGGGGQAITNQANQNFQQQTIPSILNALGGGSKGSSALNQALAAGASNLNTDLAAMLSQLQLSAASGLGGLGLGQSGQGLGTSQFAYAPRQTPFWQQATLGAINAGGKAAGAFLGA